MKISLILTAILFLFTGCATLTSDSMIPMTISFSDGSSGKCVLQNKRGSWNVDIPATVMVRRSDDVLKYDAETEDGRETTGSIPSHVGAKIIASAVFLDFGIVDGITDKHRYYTSSFVIPIKKTGEKKDIHKSEDPELEKRKIKEKEE